MDNIGVDLTQECLSHEYESLTVGCSGSVELMEFKTGCIQQPIHGKNWNTIKYLKLKLIFIGYTCHGSWQENGTYYVITSPIARKSTDSLRYCFIYTINMPNQQQSIDGTLINSQGPTLMKLSGVSESCRRDIVPGIDGRWSFNFTSNGRCLFKFFFLESP